MTDQSIQLHPHDLSPDALRESSFLGEEIMSQELGNQLIQIYSSTSSLETRSLITQLMHNAGESWLRRLVMRNSSR
jgi:hypothetical protein